MIRTVLAAAVVAAALPAAAQQTNLTRSPEQIADYLRQFGTIEIDQSSSGRPLLRGVMDGLNYGVLIYGCEDSRLECDSLQYYASFTGSDLSMENLNIWNMDNRFGSAYRDPTDGAFVLMFNVNIDGGTTVDNFFDTFEYFRDSLDRFEQFVFSDDPNPQPFPSDDNAPPTTTTPSTPAQPTGK